MRLIDRLGGVRLAGVHQPGNPAQRETDDEEDDKCNQPVLVEAEKQFFSFWHGSFCCVVRDECGENQIV